MRVTFPIVRFRLAEFEALPVMTPYTAWRDGVKVWREWFLGQWIIGYDRGRARMPEWRRPIVVVTGELA